MRNWMIEPPKRPSTWVDPLGELPEFLQRRLETPRRPAPQGQYTYKHPYVAYLEDMVLWARNEHNAEFQYAVNSNNRKMMEGLRQFGFHYILVYHPEFASMIEIITPKTWEMIPRPVQDHLIRAYEIAQELKVVRKNIGLSAAIEAIKRAEPTNVDVVGRMIEHFEKKHR
jgi:hypothetical protein